MAFPANNHAEAWRYLVSTQSIQLELKDHTEPLLQLAQPIPGQGLSHYIADYSLFLLPLAEAPAPAPECKSLFSIFNRQSLSVSATSWRFETQSPNAVDVSHNKPVKKVYSTINKLQWAWRCSWMSMNRMTLNITPFSRGQQFWLVTILIDNEACCTTRRVNLLFQSQGPEIHSWPHHIGMPVSAPNALQPFSKIRIIASYNSVSRFEITREGG